MSTMFFTLVWLLASQVATVPDVQKCVLNGKEFVCFTQADALALLEQRMKYLDLELKVKILDEKIIVKESELGILQSANKNLSEQIKFFSTENARLQVEIQDQDAWYKSPYIWSIVGFFVGSGSTIAIIYLSNRD